MDKTSIRTLIELNQRFYERHADSFSATRENGWPGWREVMRLAGVAGIIAHSPEPARALRVLDVACGNLRFERFLADEYPGTIAESWCIDSNEELMRAGANALRSEKDRSTHLVKLAILETLLEGNKLPVPTGSHDLVACFGFMHHVPGEELRRELARELVHTARPGGIIAVSFWQFMDDKRLAAKAQEADRQAMAPFQGPDQSLPANGAAARPLPTNQPVRAERGPLDLEQGDHFLGWQGNTQTLRYCHHFTEAEIDALARSVSSEARELARFSADGKNNSLNRYLVLMRS